MGDFKSIGTTQEASMQVSVEDLPLPGANGHFVVEAHFKSDRFRGKDRKGDRSLRLFNCEALLSDSPVTTRAVTGSFGKDDSSTYLLAKSEAPSFVIETPNSEIRLDSNLDLEVSIAYSDIEATSAYEARSIFEDQLQPYLDRLSFLHNVPIHMGQVVVADKINELQFLFFQSPPRRSQITEGEERFSARMMPIYALYRESQNTTSPYYRLLSLYKIMEGLLNSLRAEVLKELRRAQTRYTRSQINRARLA